MLMSVQEFLERFKNGTLPDMTEKCARCGEPLDYHPDEPGCIGKIESEGKIRIVKVPQGEAPLEIREKWIGVEIPAVGFISQNDDAYNISSGEKIPTEAQYIVFQKEAIEALRKKDGNASAWWEAAGFPNQGYYCCFGFRAEEVEEIEPVYPRL